MKTAIFKVTETYGDGREKVVYKPMFVTTTKVAEICNPLMGDLPFCDSTSWKPLLYLDNDWIIPSQDYNRIARGILDGYEVCQVVCDTQEWAEKYVNKFLKYSAHHTKEEIVQIKEQL